MQYSFRRNLSSTANSAALEGKFQDINILDISDILKKTGSWVLNYEKQCFQGLLASCSHLKSKRIKKNLEEKLQKQPIFKKFKTMIIPRERTANFDELKNTISIYLRLGSVQQMAKLERVEL